MRRLQFRIFCVAILGLAMTARLQAQEPAWIELEGGSKLAATLWVNDRPIGRALMVHGCLKSQEEFGHLPEQLFRAGYSVLTYDMYSHGRSQTPVIEFTSQAAHDELLGRVPSDAARALFLLDERMREEVPLTLVLSGCTAAWASDLIETATGLENVVLFSGPLHPDLNDVLGERENLSVLGVTTEDDAERMRIAIQRTVDASAGPKSEVFVLPTGGHGAAGILQDQSDHVTTRILGWLAGPPQG